MTRLQRPVPRVELQPVFVCDGGCGEEVAGLLAPAGWLVLRVARDEMTTHDPPHTFDKEFCSVTCMEAWLSNAPVFIP